MNVLSCKLLFSFRMKPRKIKEDDAPRTIACPHKVSVVDVIVWTPSESFTHDTHELFFMRRAALKCSGIIQP